MANLRNELKSRQTTLRRLHDDLRDSSFARLEWSAEVRARRTLDSDATIEHWFLAELFLLTWSNWAGLLERFCRYFGQELESFPKTWSQLIANCNLLVFTLTRDQTLDEFIARSWTDSEPMRKARGKHREHDVAATYTHVARNHERANLLSRAARIELPLAVKEKLYKRSVPGSGDFGMSRSVVLEQNERLLDQWHELPRRMQDQILVHLRHYVHSTLCVSWLTDSRPEASALLSLSWRSKPMSLARQPMVGFPQLETQPSDSLAKLLDRLKAAISELGYDAIIEDLSSPDLIGGEDSLLASQDVMVIPGYLEDAARPILLAATKGWSGNSPRSFTKLMRQIKARLIESRGATQTVVPFCDSWDSTSFEEEHAEELRAFANTGIRFIFYLVGVPDRKLVPITVGFDDTKP